LAHSVKFTYRQWHYAKAKHGSEKMKTFDQIVLDTPQMDSPGILLSVRETPESRAYFGGVAGMDPNDGGFKGTVRIGKGKNENRKARQSAEATRKSQDAMALTPNTSGVVTRPSDGCAIFWGLVERECDIFLKTTSVGWFEGRIKFTGENKPCKYAGWIATNDSPPQRYPLGPIGVGDVEWKAALMTRMGDLAVAKGCTPEEGWAALTLIETRYPTG